MQARVVDGLAGEWDELAAGCGLYASPGWLAAMRTRLGGQPVTLLVTQRDAPGGIAGNTRPVLAAFATVQPRPRQGEFFDLHHILISEAPALPLTGAARDARLQLTATAPGPGAWVPNLVVMLPGYECVPVGLGAGDPAALAALIDEAVAYAVELRLHAVAFLYLRPEAVALAAALGGRGFTPVPLSLTWDLPVPRGGLAEHLRSLPRKRRTEVHRELSRLRDAGIRLDRLEPDQVAAPQVLAELAGLRCQLVAKYRGQADPQVELDRLRLLVNRVARGQPVTLVAQAGDVLVGFAMFAEHGGAWHCVAVGYDYTDPRSRLAYFGTAFYAALDEASAGGIGWLRYGQGSAAAKQARGCRGTALTAWVRALDPSLEAALLTSARTTALIPIEPT
jgi:hypothetical protein